MLDMRMMMMMMMMMMMKMMQMCGSMDQRQMMTVVIK